ncbi:MAG TPA: glycerophosphodiester phosphodiesterase [Verrucomicrobiales bacterium]|nr:glycerophosphodiester phosphodiesterase [Verrucomicrobiales bacterium]HIL70458.1 glycerophosphodiester phosphodiesterase [Verrucomicrobiota bacterium]
MGIFIVTTLMTTKVQALEFIAHRGASHDAPENTLAAVNLGWHRNVDAVEIDVYLSRDGHIVVHHDKNTKRTGGYDGEIQNQTLEQLRNLDFGAWKSSKWKGELIPTLEEVLRTIPEGKRLFIEIKCGPEILPVLERDLKNAGKKPDQTAIISFSYDVVTQAKKLMPNLMVYYLSGFKQDKKTGRWTPAIDELIAKTVSGGLDGLDVSYKGPLTSESVQRIKKAGLSLVVYTVDDPPAGKGLIDVGVDGITTNRPKWLKEQISTSSP